MFYRVLRPTTLQLYIRVENAVQYFQGYIEAQKLYAIIWDTFEQMVATFLAVVKVSAGRV